jgi:hypothetical protein
MKTYRGREGAAPRIFTSTLGRRSTWFTSGGWNTGTHCTGDWVVPGAGMNIVTKRNLTAGNLTENLY